MVKRYAHTAVVTVTTGALVKGEWVEDESQEIEVIGQYFPSNSGNVKTNVDGEERPVHGEFSTKALPAKGATHIRIDRIGLDTDIIVWEPFQTHSVIYV